MNKPNYKNWIPKSLILYMSVATLLSLTALILCCIQMHSFARIILAIIFGTAFIICGKTLQWSIYAYRAFSYNGKRKLAKQIVEGTSKYIRLPKNGIGLDVGCGSGALTNACAKLNPNASMIGIDRWCKDYAEFSLPLCVSNAEAEGIKNVSFKHGNALNLDFPDEYFDAVTSNYVYHNITGANKQKLLLETLRVLKKGGTFAIHDIMSKHNYGDMQIFVQKLKDMGYEKVELIDSTNGMFMSKHESKMYMLQGSSLLIGKK